MTNIFAQISNTAILRSGLTNGKNVIEAYERLFLTLIDYKSYNSVSKEQLKMDFMDFYKISITNMFLGTFIQSMKMGGYLKEKDDILFINQKRISDLSLASQYQSIVRESDVLVDDFKEFLSSKGVALGKESIELIIEKHIESTVCELGLPDNKKDNINDKELYFVSLYLKNVKENKPSLYEIYKNLLYGRMLAVFISGDEKNLHLKDSIFKKAVFYLDSGFVFNLLGLNNYSTKDEYGELVVALNKMGAKFRVFRHTFDEMSEIIFSSRDWVGDFNYSPSRASKVTTYFIQNKFTKEEIEEYFYSFEAKLKEYEIEIDDYEINYNEEEKTYEENFYNMLIEDYNSTGFFDSTKEKTYRLDAKSLFSILKLRKGKVYRRVSDTEFVLLTTNKGISRIANKFNREQYKCNNVSLAISDSFLNLMLVLSCGNYSETASERILIPVAFHAFEPSKELLMKMEKTLKEMGEKGLLDEKEILNWKTSNLLISGVVENTTNDSNNFNEDTPEAVILKYKNDANEMIENISREANEKIEKNNKILQEQINENIQLRDKIKAKNEQIINANIDIINSYSIKRMKKEKIINRIRNVFFWIILMAAIIVFGATYLVVANLTGFKSVIENDWLRNLLVLVGELIISFLFVVLEKILDLKKKMLPKFFVAKLQKEIEDLTLKIDGLTKENENIASQ